MNSTNFVKIFLHDGDGQSILAIDDGALRQNLIIEIVNTSNTAITFNSIEIDKYHHLALNFRPGTLLENSLKENKINLLEQDWQMSQSQDKNSFYFACKAQRVLNYQEKIVLTLQDVSAEPAGGARGTRVELEYKNLTWESNLVSGTQLYYLNVVNQRGKKQIPLYVGFTGSTKTQKDEIVEVANKQGTDEILQKNLQLGGSDGNRKENTIVLKNLRVVGSNKILNDGTENELILTFRYLRQMQDPAQKQEVGLSWRGKDKHEDAATNFKISFDVLPENQPDIGAGLLKINDADKVEISVNENFQAHWQIDRNKQSATPQWIVTRKTTPTETTSSEGELLRLNISKLKTQLQAGYANLYVYYENIPGYWDGYIICPVEKGPLMLRKDGQEGDTRESIGIGTDMPIAKLHVKHEKAETNIAVFEGESGVKIQGARGKRNALWIADSQTDYPSLMVQQSGEGQAAFFSGNVLITGSSNNSTNSTLKSPALGIFSFNRPGLSASGSSDDKSFVSIAQLGKGNALSINTSSLNEVDALTVNHAGTGRAAYFQGAVAIEGPFFKAGEYNKKLIEYFEKKRAANQVWIDLDKLAEPEEFGIKIAVLNGVEFVSDASRCKLCIDGDYLQVVDLELGKILDHNHDLLRKSGGDSFLKRYIKKQLNVFHLFTKRQIFSEILNFNQEIFNLFKEFPENIQSGIFKEIFSDDYILQLLEYGYFQKLELSQFNYDFFCTPFDVIDCTNDYNMISKFQNIILFIGIIMERLLTLVDIRSDRDEQKAKISKLKKDIQVNKIFERTGKKLTYLLEIYRNKQEINNKFYTKECQFSIISSLNKEDDDIDFFLISSDKDLPQDFLDHPLQKAFKSLDHKYLESRTCVVKWEYWKANISNFISYPGLTHPDCLVDLEIGGKGIGLKQHNIDDLAICTNGQRQLQIDKDGNVKIAGSISCGGRIAIKSYRNLYLSQPSSSEKINTPIFRDSEPSNSELFTLEMSCSREIKDNIAPLSAEEATRTLEQLNAVKYDYKNEPAFRPNLGFIAEEMPANLASEDHKTLSPFEIIPVLTKVVQEQQQTIKLLQNEVKELQQKVNQ